MFTGIISHLGIIKAHLSRSLLIETDKKLLKQLSKGMSVSVNGICLTVTSFDSTSFSIDYMPETADKTNIGVLNEGAVVNLELPATSQSFLAGHIVQGHVDGKATIKTIRDEGNSRIITLSIPKVLNKYIVSKGSITLNGISLTVISVTNDNLTVGIIPHTWNNTMLHTAKAGDLLNVEVDVLAKYVEKLLLNRNS